MIDQTWGSEKTAIQWLRRRAQREHVDIEIVKLDQSHMFIAYSPTDLPSPNIVYGTHKWNKANTLNLSDGDGQYDKLYCVHCGLRVKRYRRFRHFKEQFQICDKNIITEEE